MRGLVGPVAQVRRIVPEPARADAHARRQKVPYIHFAQEYPVAMELVQHRTSARSHDAGASDPGVAVTTHFHVNPLEVGANQDRSRGVGRACQETLGAPEKKIMTDQPAVTLLAAWRAATIFTSLAMSHGAQSIGTDVPDETRGQGDMEAIANGVGATVKQRLAAAITMILDAVTRAAIFCGTIID